MDYKSRPLSALLHQAIATGDIERVQELLKEGASANRPISISENIVEKVRRKSKSNSISSRLSSASNLEPISESTPSKPLLLSNTSMERNSLNLTYHDSDINTTQKDDTVADHDIINGMIDDAFGQEQCEQRTHDEDQKLERTEQGSSETLTNDTTEEILENDVNETEESVKNNILYDQEEFVNNHNEGVSNKQPHQEIYEDRENNQLSETNEQHTTTHKDTVLQTEQDDTNDNKQDDMNTNEYNCRNKPELDDTDSNAVEDRDVMDEETKNDYEEPVQEDIEAIISSLEPLRDHDNERNNNNRKSIADTIDEKLRDDNETLIERQASIIVRPDANDETDKSPLKIIPRIKRKLSMKWRNRSKTKDREFEEETDFEEFYENVPKARNVDDEQVAENYEGVAFFEAVREGMDMIVQTLLETSNNYQLDLPDENGFTPAMQAAWHGQTDCLEILLDHGADIRQPNTAGCTAVHFAAGQGHYECLELLLNYSDENDIEGSIEDVRTKFGATPLILASRGGHTKCTELLLKHGADPNIQYRGNQNALLFAAGNGHYECIEALLESNVHIDQANSQGVTPLMRAVQQGHNTCVVLLIDNAAALDFQDSIGRSAVHFAVEHKNQKALKLLLEEGARIDLKTKGGSTPMTYADRFQHYKCGELLENRLDEIRELALQEERNKKMQENANKAGQEEVKKVEKPPTCGVFKNIFRRKKRVINE